MPRRPKVSTAILIGVLLTTPILVALVSLHGEPWAPVFDMALIEFHVRDVLTGHTPLLGPAGRFGSFDAPASHPGPLPYYLLAPTYRLLGGSAWALQVASAMFHVGAIVTAMWLAERRGRAPCVIAVGAGLALLMQGYGLTLLTSCWNPHLPVLWFVVFMMAVWSVACGDLALFPLAAAAASLCAQSHISYVPVCGAVGVLAAVAMVYQLLSLPRGSAERTRGVRFFGLAIALVIVLWLPPIIEELTGSPGNVTQLVNYFHSQSDASLGFLGALPVLLMRLDSWHLIVEQFVHPGGFEIPLSLPQPEPWRGAVTFAVWLASALASMRYGDRSLRVLHGVLGVGVVIALSAMSRIFAGVWNYIVLWGWAIGASLVVASAATLVLALSRITATRPRLRAAGPWLAIGIVAISTLRLTWLGLDFKPRNSTQNEQLALLVPEVITALEARVGAATGKKGRYVIAWTDGFYGGGQAIGLANELDRAGFDVGLEPHLAGVAGAHRTRPKNAATAQIHFATGGWIRRLRRVPGAIEVAWLDLRTSPEENEYEKLKAAIRDGFRAAGKKDAARFLEYQLPPVTADMSPLIALALGRLAELGVPAAVFIAPPDAEPKRRRKKSKRR